MEIEIKKIDGEFVIVELKNGEQKVCPKAIFPKRIKKGDAVCVKIIDDFSAKEKLHQG